MRILISGASGLLGLNLGLHCLSDHTMIGLVHSHLIKESPFPIHVVDLGEEKTARAVIDQFKPDVLFNCAALADLDACEKDPIRAQRLNAELPGWLAEECDCRSVQLVHISTDAVFDGCKEGKYREEDKTNPLSIYAQTKLQGEKNVLQVNSSALVARVNFYGFSISGKRSLAEVFLNNLREGKSMFGFTDVLFSPLYVIDLVEILLKMVEKQFSGLYHVTSPESQSKYAFGTGIAQRFGLDANLITPIKVADANFLTAPRSQNLVLDPGRVQAALRVNLPGQRQGLDHFYQDFQDGFAQRIYGLQ
ncbi:MAG: SDR family oxidoreductase [Pelolinea sp.]|jgi:dTDP-4-dehydrorhamnose reductase|nr:SDR family oxidoreductase [Pelolinea sp.]